MLLVEAETVSERNTDDVWESSDRIVVANADNLVAAAAQVLPLAGGSFGREQITSLAARDRTLAVATSFGRVLLFDLSDPPPPAAFGVGTQVRLTDGVFAKFTGAISAVEGETLTVEVVVFGRATPVTVTTDQVEAVD